MRGRVRKAAAYAAASTILTGRFWVAALERAVKTGAQTLAAMLTASGAGLIDADWYGSLSVSGMAAIISLLTSVGSDVATGSGPSLGRAESVVPEVRYRHHLPGSDEDGFGGDAPRDLGDR